MAATQHLAFPQLNARRFGARLIPVLTDETLFELTGIRIAFTGREGGVSEAPFVALNLGSQVGDDAAAVHENRSMLLEALGAPEVALVVPNQVHGDNLVSVDQADESGVDKAQNQAQEGADALVVSVPNVAALLCFADCVPVIIASPTGRFAVVHAGWRGVENGIAAKAVEHLTAADAADNSSPDAGSYNVYVGPHIHAECFETGADVRERFVARFGRACAPDERHVDLLAALSLGLVEVGIDPARIADAGICTQCSSGHYYSYRAMNGVCGRHGAVAFRRAG